MDLETAKKQAERLISEAKEEIKAGKVEHDALVNFTQNIIDGSIGFNKEDLQGFPPNSKFPQGYYIVPKNIMDAQFVSHRLADTYMKAYRELMREYAYITSLETENIRLKKENLQLDEKACTFAAALKSAKDYIARMHYILTELNNNIYNFKQLFNKAAMTIKRREKNKSVSESTFKNVDIDDFLR